MPIPKNLDITCGSELPTNFEIKTQSPFSISKNTFALLPGKSAGLRVDFDPGLKYDKVSGLIKSKL